MAGDTWLLIGTGALLVFWAVGAHNRLSAVRDRLVRRHAEVDRVLRLRRKAVIAWVATVGEADTADGSLNESVLHACAQAEAASEGARRAPTARGAIAALTMAEQVLERTMRGFMAHPAAESRPASTQRRAAWVACEVQLAVARQAFNREVAAYNAAVTQFPASLIAAFGGLRPTAPLEAGPELSPAAAVATADGRDAWAEAAASAAAVSGGPPPPAASTEPGAEASAAAAASASTTGLPTRDEAAPTAAAPPAVDAVPAGYRDTASQTLPAPATATATAPDVSAPPHPSPAAPS